MLYDDNNRSSSRSRGHQLGKVVIVDWDDTILPSTFVDRWQIENSRDLPLHVSVVYNIYITVVQQRLLLRPFQHHHPSLLHHFHRFLSFQFQNLLAELARCAEQFLAEAAKYGEVSQDTPSYHRIVHCSSTIAAASRELPPGPSSLQHHHHGSASSFIILQNQIVVRVGFCRYLSGKGLR